MLNASGKLHLSRVKEFVLDVILTMSLLSMPTFRRLAETELMSFSVSQDLKSFTAKHAETPEQMHKNGSQLLPTDLPG